MARPEKVAVVDEVREELEGNLATLLTEYRGLTVSELAELRTELRQAGARYVVVKNTLARIAAKDAGYEGLEEILTGPTALTYCGDDPVAPAKALRKFAKDHPELVVKGGILEGRIVDAETAEKLADLETREELLGKLAGMMYAMLSNTASLLQAPLGQMARLIAALESKVEEEDGPAEAPAPEAEASTDTAEAEVEAPEAESADEPAAAESTDEPEAETADEPAAETESADEPAAEAADEPEAEVADTEAADAEASADDADDADDASDDDVS